jgi:hypothetical protein
MPVQQVVSTIPLTHKRHLQYTPLQEKQWLTPGAALVFDYTKWPQKAENLEPLVGQSGFLTVFQFSINGSDEQDHLIIRAVSDTGEILPERSARRFFDLSVTEISPGLTQSDADATTSGYCRRAT